MPLFLLLTVIAAPAQAAVDKPNIVILYADDMGIGDLSCYGAPDIRTPNLDALASAGVKFTSYYSAAPVCSPSRAALLTGRYPIRAGVPSNVSSEPGQKGMPAEQMTLAELVRPAGYTTGLVGKWHLGTSSDCVPNAQGFDSFFGHHAGCIDFWSHMFYYGGGVPHHDLFRNGTEIFEYGKNMTDLIGREASAFIDQHKADPFFLFVPFNAPHYPLQAPDRFVEPYAKLKKQRRDYVAMVAHLDDVIGRIMTALTRAKLQEKTAVFFASDNGPSVEARTGYGGGSAGPYRGFKFGLFEGGIRMPMIASFPGRFPAGQSRDQTAIAMDLFATVAELTGATIPEGHRIDGQSLLPILENNTGHGRDVIFYQFGKQKAVRQGDFKLVVNVRHEESRPPSALAATMPTPKTVGQDEVFLFNLATDPSESRNLADADPGRFAELMAAHDEWARDVSSR
jgi:arylsulfatase A-like enzyme